MADLTLLRQLIRHRRAEGWTKSVYGHRPLQTHSWQRYRDGCYEWVRWDGFTLSVTRLGLSFTAASAASIITAERVASLLAAFGLVPVELTPAYEAGWRAGVVDAARTEAENLRTWEYFAGLAFAYHDAPEGTDVTVAWREFAEAVRHYRAVGGTEPRFLARFEEEAAHVLPQ